jgi:diguanylate cyclase (GGDEF)-like protein
MIIDIDNFKDVNDSHGHLFGDSVLTEISGKLRDMFRSSDILGRFGGDEFIVFLKNMSDKEMIAEKARMVCDIFRDTYTGKNKDYKISGSVGVSLYPNHGKTFSDLFHKADSALYDAKCRGKDCYVIYDVLNHIDDMEEKRVVHYFEK